jgi:hypothetical protein
VNQPPASGPTFADLYKMRGPVHYRLEYRGINPYPTADYKVVYVFRVLASSPSRDAEELTFGGGNPPRMAVGTIVECDLPAERLGRCIDAPIDSYEDLPPEVVFKRYATTQP